jgi:hypothetical protein
MSCRGIGRCLVEGEGCGSDFGSDACVSGAGVGLGAGDLNAGLNGARRGGCPGKDGA